MTSPQFHSLAGVFAFVAIAWLISERRREVPWLTVGAGLLLQLVLALLLLKVPGTQGVFAALGDAVAALDRATSVGTSFVFGFLGGGSLPYAETTPGSSFVLAFRALPLVLVIGALSSLLYYWRVLPIVVRGFSWLLERTMRVGGAVGLSSAANVFVGMVEAPMVVKPYLATMSRADLFIVMTAGMASIAGTVFGLYAIILAPIVPGAAGHLLVASLVSAPAAITVALLMVPTGHVRYVNGERREAMTRSPAQSTMDAITRGTFDAVGLLINVTAMLIVLIALVALANLILAALLPPLDGAPVSLQRLLGFALSPLAWLLGIPWSEAPAAGALLGTKTVLNEFLAYVEMANLSSEALSARSRLILTYALCGFANFGSVGIMVGGLTSLVPERNAEIVELGTRSIVSGLLATCMTGAWVGVLTA